MCFQRLGCWPVSATYYAIDSKLRKTVRSKAEKTKEAPAGKAEKAPPSKKQKKTK